MTGSYDLIVLRISDPHEAQRLLDDTASHPGQPLLTPGQENAVHFEVCRDASTRPACPSCGHHLSEHGLVSDDLAPCSCCEVHQ
jgi:hypothetical protein